MKIIPAICTENMDVFRQQFAAVTRYADEVHIDIADNYFVNKATIDLPAVLEDLKSFRGEIHLMVTDPDRYRANLEQLPTWRGIVHVETSTDYSWPASAINPSSPVGQLTKLSWEPNEVLIMTVEPGAQGRPFLNENLHKLPEIRAMLPNALITIDGGVNLTTLPQILPFYPDRIIVGSAIWQSEDPAEMYSQLSAALKHVH